MPNRGVLRFGIIGCSSVARRRFLPALQKSSLARLERIGSRSPAKAAEYALAFSCAKSGSYEAVLEDPEVDAIYISLPVVLHEHWLREAARRKKHILCEKPAFCSLSTGLRLVQECRENGVRLMEGYMFRYHPQHELVRKLLRENAIGRPMFFSGEYAVPRPGPDNIRFKPDLGGGVFLDAAGYPPAAAAMHIEALPVRVFCSKYVDGETGVDTAVAMMVEFADGQMGHYRAAYGLQFRARYSLHGTLGRIEVERAFAINSDVEGRVLHETNDGVKCLTTAPADQFLLMIDDFARQVGGGAAGTGSFESDLVRQHTFMEAARRSMAEQRCVALSEVAA
jgi:dTDP-3,4-didehydro-2,6-dideoxy-alpha-D-glucose 3-reductase